MPCAQCQYIINHGVSMFSGSSKVNSALRARALGRLGVESGVQIVSGLCLPYSIDSMLSRLASLADELDLQSFCEHASSSSVRSLRAASLCACSAHQRQSRPSRRIAIAGGMTAVRAP